MVNIISLLTLLDIPRKYGYMFWIHKMSLNMTLACSSLVLIHLSFIFRMFSLLLLQFAVAALAFYTEAVSNL